MSGEGSEMPMICLEQIIELFNFKPAEIFWIELIFSK
jgi:hypothetical protein